MTPSGSAGRFGRRIPSGIGLSLLSALSFTLAFPPLSFTLAFPPFDLWPLIWVGLVPMVVAQHRVLPARLSGLAPALGIGGLFRRLLRPHVRW